MRGRGDPILKKEKKLITLSVGVYFEKHVVFVLVFVFLFLHTVRRNPIGVFQTED